MKENRHKIATQKFLKIATFLEKISTFVFFIAFLCNNFFLKNVKFRGIIFLKILHHKK